jgi:hypothetical protein
MTPEARAKQPSIIVTMACPHAIVDAAIAKLRLKTKGGDQATGMASSAAANSSGRGSS